MSIFLSSDTSQDTLSYPSSSVKEFYKKFLEKKKERERAKLRARQNFSSRVFAAKHYDGEVVKLKIDSRYLFCYNKE